MSRPGFLKAGLRDLPIDPESGESKSPLHKSVYRRFEAGSVLLYDRMAAYRPDNMRVHVDFKHHFGGSAAQLPQCVADDIEQKWENAGYVGRLLPTYNIEEVVLSGGFRVALGPPKRAA